MLPRSNLLILPLIFIVPVFLAAGQWGTTALVGRVAATEDQPALIRSAPAGTEDRQKIRLQVQQARPTNAVPEPERAQLRIQENPQERSQENVREQRQEIARERVLQVHTQRLNQRFRLYFQRLDWLIAKVQSRIDKMAEAGYDIDAAQTKLNEASIALEDAKELSDQSLAEFGEVDPDNYPSQRAQALAARELAQSALEAYKNVQRLLVEAIQLIKASSPAEELE
jgi:uncharacterized DUF497 family protein